MPAETGSHIAILAPEGGCLPYAGRQDRGDSMGKESKDRWLHVRLTQTEYDELTRKAAELGTNNSSLIRALACTPVALGSQAVLAKGYRGLKYPLVVLNVQHLEEVAQQVRFYGYHYNQAVRALNTIASKRFMRADIAEGYMERAVTELQAITETAAELTNAVDDMRDVVQRGHLVRVEDWGSLRNDDAENANWA